MRPWLLSFAALFLVACGGSGSSGEATIPFEYRGMHLAVYTDAQLDTAEFAEALDSLQADHATWVSIDVNWFQATLTSSDIHPGGAGLTPSDAALIRGIRAAKAKGFKVMLRPTVDTLDNNWRGFIVPSAGWFDSYAKFMNKYAAMAEAEGVDALCVGVEYNGTQVEESSWREVVRQSRDNYSGPITYAANWDAKDKVAWWDAVDFVGIDAYFPLTDSNANDINTYRKHLRDGAAAVTALWKTTFHGKPVAFLETGCKAYDGAAKIPYDFHLDGPVDQQEQALVYQATLEVYSAQPWFAGVFFWNWGMEPGSGGPTDTNYTVKGKPAEQVMSDFFSRP